MARHHQRNKDTANQEGEERGFSFTPELRGANRLTNGLAAGKTPQAQKHREQYSAYSHLLYLPFSQAVSTCENKTTERRLQMQMERFSGEMERFQKTQS